MSNALGINYVLDVEVLSPIHIGCGRKLQQGYDWVHEAGVTYRLDEARVLDEIWSALSPREQDLLLSKPLSDVVEARRGGRQLRDFAQYEYRGQPTLGEIYEHIKTVHGRPYLPGSSLKGALRTAMIRTMVEGVDKKPYTRDMIGRAMANERDARSAKAAAEQIEHNYAGPGPNEDVFRALQVGDSDAPAESLALQKLQVVPGLDLDVEVMRPGTRLTMPIRIDSYLINTAASTLGFEKSRTDVVRSITRAARFAVEERITKELNRHVKLDEQPPARFYRKLYDELRREDFDRTTFFIQVGFATGWRAKTMLGELDESSALLSQVVNDFYLNRGGKGRGREHAPGDEFPRARHLAYQAGTPALPMGWLRVKVTRV